ncbi:hypothetical protein Tco_0329197 [Tanacetum coccineum]
MSDSEDSTVTITILQISDPGPEEPEQAPPSPIYVPFVPEPVYPEFLPEDDVLPAEEQPWPYDQEEGSSRQEEHLLLPYRYKSVAYIQLTRTLYLAYRVMARMSIRPHALAPFLSEEVAKECANNEKSSVNEPSEVELKDLPPSSKYAFLEGNDKLPVIIAKDLKNEEKAALIEVLKSHKRAIA